MLMVELTVKGKYDPQCERIECFRLEIMPTNSKSSYRKYI